MRIFLIILTGLASLFLIGATLRAAGDVSVPGGGWLLPGGLATLAVAWCCSLIALAGMRP